MPLLRPAVAQDDDFLSKIVKYIPAEIIAVYTAIIGALKKDLNSSLPPEKDVKTYFIVFLIILVITPIWTYFAVIDNPKVTEPPSKMKRAIFHAAVALIAFVIWVYAIGDILFKSWLCGCYAKNTDGLKCFDLSGKYNSVLGAVVLILFTGLAVPILERIILGKPIPPPPVPVNRIQ